MVFVTVNLNASESSVNILSVLGEPFKAEMGFDMPIKSIKVYAINSDRIKPDSFEFAINSHQVQISTALPILEPVLAMTLELEFDNNKKLRRKFEFLLPLSKSLDNKALSANDEKPKLDALKARLKEKNISLNAIKQSLNLYRNLVFVLAIFILLLIWYLVRYRRKMNNLSTNSNFNKNHVPKDNNDYFLEIAEIYKQQHNFTEAEKLARRILNSGNEEQKAKAKEILQSN